MNDPIGLSHDEYVADRRERDLEFAAAYDETRTTMELALGLADLREHRNLTQRALAEKSGIKQPMINRIERGSQVPRPVTLLRLLAALDGVLTMLPIGKIEVLPAEAAISAVQPEVRRESRAGTEQSGNGSSAVAHRQYTRKG
jgi:transcriptional regulator with XRE-family HTH domain